MSSMPLPALSLNKIAPPADPFQQYGNILALKQQMAAQPLQLQNLQNQNQAGQLENQQRQIALKDQQAVTAAMTNWDGKDLDQLYPLVLKNGGSGQAVLGLKQKALEMQSTIAQTAKNGGEAAVAQITATQKKGDTVAGALGPLADPNQVPDAQLPQALQQTVQSLVQNGALDPQHAQAATQLLQSGNPQAIRAGLKQFTNTMLAQSQITEQALKKAETDKAAAEAVNAAGKINPQSPLYEPSPASVALGTAPGAQQIQGNEVQMAGRKANAEAAAHLPYEVALNAQKQALEQGDPMAAAKLLVNGDATLAELKARGATPNFIQQALNGAHHLSGGKYNSMEQDANFDVAKSPANVAFFGSAKSLTDKGGTLDQLAKVGRLIPQSQLPSLNSLEDWQKAAAGNGPLAKYAATALGVADDYSKVMGGGQGSDSSRLQALNLIKANGSPDARSSAIEGIRGAVGSQLKSRIGSNPILGRMYGGSSSTPAAAPTPQSHAFSLSAWQKANPQGNVAAAKAAAAAAGYTVTQ